MKVDRFCIDKDTCHRSNNGLGLTTKICFSRDQTHRTGRQAIATSLRKSSPASSCNHPCLYRPCRSLPCHSTTACKPQNYQGLPLGQPRLIQIRWQHRHVPYLHLPILQKLSQLQHCHFQPEYLRLCYLEVGQWSVLMSVRGVFIPATTPPAPKPTATRTAGVHASMISGITIAAVSQRCSFTQPWRRG